MSDITLHSFVTGRVQGVWFRQATKEQALSLGLKGWVRNLNDGRVEVLATGENKAVRQLEAWLGKGPQLANVIEVSSEFSDADQSFTEFDVI